MYEANDCFALQIIEIYDKSLWLIALWQLNLLVATKVGEEGLDIQTCCLVIRFDLPETVSSFIQSRGRARMPQSEYAFLVDRSSFYIYLNHKHFSNNIL